MSWLVLYQSEELGMRILVLNVKNKPLERFPIFRMPTCQGLSALLAQLYATLPIEVML